MEESPSPKYHFQVVAPMELFVKKRSDWFEQTIESLKDAIGGRT